MPQSKRKSEGAAPQSKKAMTKKESAVQQGKKKKKARFDGAKVYESPDGSMLLFWQPPAVYGQWAYSPFVGEDGCEYTCAEQFMMAEKARLFGDEEVRRVIIESGHNPRLHKKLGRQVSGFDEAKWLQHREDIVVRGNVLKFSQNPEMRAELMASGDKILVEASPMDTIWGIGYSAANPKAFDQNTWRGLNLLGKALMAVRARFVAEDEAAKAAQAGERAAVPAASAAQDSAPAQPPAPKSAAKPVQQEPPA